MNHARIIVYAKHYKSNKTKKTKKAEKAKKEKDIIARFVGARLNVSNPVLKQLYAVMSQCF